MSRSERKANRKARITAIENELILKAQEASASGDNPEEVLVKLDKYVKAKIAECPAAAAQEYALAVANLNNVSRELQEKTNGN